MPAGFSLKFRATKNEKRQLAIKEIHRKTTRKQEPEGYKVERGLKLGTATLVHVTDPLSSEPAVPEWRRYLSRDKAGQ